MSISEDEGRRKASRLKWWGIGTSVVWVATFGVIVYFNFCEAGTMGLNEWGDFLAGFFAPLALFWLIIGYFQQGIELQLNTEALKIQQEELQQQVQETANLARSAERQAKAAEDAVSLNKTEVDRQERVLAAEAKPVFKRGRIDKGRDFAVHIKNTGGDIYDVEVRDTEETHNLAIIDGKTWQNETTKKVVAESSEHLITLPLKIEIIYVNKMGVREEQIFTVADDKSDLV